MLNNNYAVKEFSDLNGYYLKVSLYNGAIHIVCYNTNLLNGIKYETNITQEEMIRKSQSQSFSTINLYELILKKIGEKKYIIKGDDMNTFILLLETHNVLNKNKDIQLVVPKNNNHIISDYEIFLSKELKKLREENKTLSNENNQLKILLRLNNISYEQKDANKIPNDISKSTMVRPSSSKLQMSQINNNNINMNNIHNNIKPLKTQPITQPKGDVNNHVIITQDINIEALSNIKYTNYPKVQTSPFPFSKIMGFGANSFQGLVRDHNEDRLKIILDHKINKSFSSNGKIITPNISYFAVYDGHGGQNCCNFLQENLHIYLFSSEFFPLYPLKAIEQSFDKAEITFEFMALDKENKRLIDKSGSCALIALIIDEWCYLSYLGDSRALYSYDSGNQLFQVSRDHKPGDIKEKTRIEKAGGKIYKDTRLKINGHKIKVNEKDAPGVVFPYRVTPGNLSVRIFIIIIIYIFLIGCKKYWGFRLQKSFNWRIKRDCYT